MKRFALWGKNPPVLDSVKYYTIPKNEGTLSVDLLNTWAKIYGVTFDGVATKDAKAALTMIKYYDILVIDKEPKIFERIWQIE